MQEIKGDLFQSEYLKDKETRILHCISADYALGAGFAREIESRYHIKEYLKIVGKHNFPEVIAVDNIINMVTKQNYWNKPTYETFDKALELVRKYCENNNIKRLIMPRIGSGLDKLDWNFCKEGIKYLIEDYDIECIVYSLV